MLTNPSPYPWFIRGCWTDGKTPWVRCDSNSQYETCIANMKSSIRRPITMIYGKTSDGFRVRWYLDALKHDWVGPEVY